MSDMRERFISLNRRIDSQGKELLKMEAQRDSLIQEAKRQKKRRDDLQASDLKLTKSTEVLGVLQRRAESKGHKMIEKVVNRALDTVFGGEHEFILVQEQKRGVTVTTPCLKRGDLILPIHDSRGGGLEDVVAFILQILAAFRVNPPLRRFFVQDEPFSQLAATQTPAMADLLRELVDEFGVTMLITSHNPEFARVADRAYEVYWDSPGKADFREITGD